MTAPYLPGPFDISNLSHARSRSISAENPTGQPGGGARTTDGVASRAARDLGPGWKVSPYTTVAAGQESTLAQITGAGKITHLWCTIDPRWWRRLILRAYWDDEPTPSIQVPLGDFFCNGWGIPADVASIPVAVNPRGGFNAYWPMPFRRSARLTIENLAEEDSDPLYYQVDYELGDITDAAAYLHTHWRRSNPVADRAVHTILDGVTGRGHYVGTYLAWQSNSTGWWGEGEMKFYLDDDEDFPSICGTGTEDYFGGAWNFEQPPGEYGRFSTPYLGLPQIIAAGAGGIYASQQRFGMYRWHLPDPIRFEDRLRVTVQALGWRAEGRYHSLRDDVASTAWWYQTEPHAPFAACPDVDTLEVI